MLSQPDCFALPRQGQLAGAEHKKGHRAVAYGKED